MFPEWIPCIEGVFVNFKFSLNWAKTSVFVITEFPRDARQAEGCKRGRVATRLADIANWIPSGGKGRVLFDTLQATPTTRVYVRLSLSVIPTHIRAPCCDPLFRPRRTSPRGSHTRTRTHTYTHSSRHVCVSSFTTPPTRSAEGVRCYFVLRRLRRLDGGCRSTTLSPLPLRPPRLPLSVTARLPRRTGFNPSRVIPGFSQVKIVTDNAVGQRGFSGISRFPPPFHSSAAPFSPHFTHASSRDLVVKSRPNLSAQLNKPETKHVRTVSEHVGSAKRVGGDTDLPLARAKSGADHCCQCRVSTQVHAALKSRRGGRDFLGWRRRKSRIGKNFVSMPVRSPR
ncbi:hypothetical protein PR048_007950 [Dryococelus australis]|uniref:Uncharacterized protein n=1 Tax=Dryococelus australis TaxID=614101 RepID=A0ABQ9HWL9_9NEOP|nr:hypothetical protein PR048_007950 [Dryococelus australis]